MTDAVLFPNELLVSDNFSGSLSDIAHQTDTSEETWLEPVDNATNSLLKVDFPDLPGDIYVPPGIGAAFGTVEVRLAGVGSVPQVDSLRLAIYENGDLLAEDIEAPAIVPGWSPSVPGTVYTLSWLTKLHTSTAWNTELVFVLEVDAGTDRNVRVEAVQLTIPWDETKPAPKKGYINPKRQKGLRRRYKEQQRSRHEQKGIDDYLVNVLTGAIRKELPIKVEFKPDESIVLLVKSDVEFERPIKKAKKAKKIPESIETLFLILAEVA